MPNLNRLAAESMVFDQAYVTQPVCTPARSSILTGLFPHTTGCTELNIPLPADCLCLPEMIEHGDLMGSHRLIAKCVMFEESVRVPLLIRLPGQQTSERISGPVSQIDLVPTLLDLMDQPLPDHLQGRSLRRVIESGDRISRESVVIEWNGPNNGLGSTIFERPMPEWMTAHASPQEILAACEDPVRTIIRPDGWKFNCSPLGEHELYNLEQDPHEMRNLYHEERRGTLVRELANEIRAWQNRTDDPVELSAS